MQILPKYWCRSVNINKYLYTEKTSELHFNWSSSLNIEDRFVFTMDRMLLDKLDFTVGFNLWPNDEGWIEDKCGQI